ncbi:hypothetical protein COMA1_70135 [Candidatus Nitrospira nitrosa]|uniref:Uncharacterized protein n=1 Tax=Candidatus Nitrospira nitrosa TaxID=1742972 RepID=A0A0S4LPU9_9BACT|nr:hypothetical protein [Candidatus Nitrospira nitrosa]CUS39295.1 hypothetical protein COMA1_70135 [Candidatus Nitrospira nitrosa]
MHPRLHDASSINRLERVLLDTLFFEATKEAVDDPVLLRRGLCDELLLQPIVPTGVSLWLLLLQPPAVQ